MIEIWKEIPGYEDLYEVSDLGRVRRKERPDKPLKPRRHTGGYLQVYLCKGGSQRTHTVHRLVLQAFVGPSDLDTRHLNGQKDDNRLCNLNYGTAKENGKDKVKHGTSTANEAHGQCKLTNLQVDEIRALYKTGCFSQRRLAEEYRVSQPHVSYLINGLFRTKTDKHGNLVNGITKKAAKRVALDG